MSKFEEYVDAILVNNPYDVAINLANMGVIDADDSTVESWEADDLKEAMVMANLNRRELAVALDVGVDPVGEAADYLTGFLYSQGNHSAVLSMLDPMTVQPTEYNQNGDPNGMSFVNIGVDWEEIFFIVATVFLLIMSIYFIRKI